METTLYCERIRKDGPREMSAPSATTCAAVPGAAPHTTRQCRVRASSAAND
jgi:hypothetical protein